jgi:hypothetical protein
MFDQLQAAADKRADQLLMRIIARIASTPAPPGVQVTALQNGVELSGKRLRRRMIDDPNLRNFGK